MWGSVSCPRTLRHVDRRSRDSNRWPTDHWMTCSTSWATFPQDAGSACLPDLCHGLKSTNHQWKGVPIWQPAEATQLLSSCGMRSILVLAQGGGRRCCAESHRCLEGRRDGESEATGSHMSEDRVKVGQLRCPYRILHRASPKCLDVITLCCACLLYVTLDWECLPNAWIVNGYQKIPDFPAGVILKT